MQHPMNKLTIQFINHIHDVPLLEWNRIAGTDYPFMRYEFLAALEISGAVSPENGWTPKHLVAYNAAGKLVAIAPCYLKQEIQGTQYLIILLYPQILSWSSANSFFPDFIQAAVFFILNKYNAFQQPACKYSRKSCH